MINNLKEFNIVYRGGNFCGFENSGILSAKVLRNRALVQSMTKEELNAWINLPHNIEELSARNILYTEDLSRKRCHMALNGVFSKFKIARNGSRKICSIHFPGEYIDLDLMVKARADFGVLAHSQCTLISFEPRDLISLAKTFPVWARYFMGELAQETVIAREWSLNVGRRSGAERVGHFLLETAIRSNAGVVAEQMNFVMPLTQNDLADAMGLSLVHTNRSLQLLRSKKFIQTYGKKFHIADFKMMSEYCGFKHQYLI